MNDEQVFQFCSSAYIEKLTGRRAHDLESLLGIIGSCSDSSIFYHTFSALRKLRRVHMPYTNDFAIWTYRNLGEEALGEKLGAIALSEYSTIEALRSRISEIILAYRAHNPSAFQKRADDPFHLFDVIGIVYLTDKFAYDLKSFRQNLDTITLDSFYFHFIESRLRTNLHVDDFSIWIEQGLKMSELAQEISDIDINVYTLEELRTNIGRLIDDYLK